MLDPMGSVRRLREFFISYVDTAFRIRHSGLADVRRELLRTPGTLMTELLLLEPFLVIRQAIGVLKELQRTSMEILCFTSLRKRASRLQNWPFQAFSQDETCRRPSFKDAACLIRTRIKQKCLRALHILGARQSSRQARGRGKPKHSCCPFWQQFQQKRYVGPARKRTFYAIVGGPISP